MQTESKFPSESPKSIEKNDLDSVRNKLKTVTKSIREDPDTLPEIARASETEEVCTPGSKEPALFQRRPNKASSVKKSEQKPKLKGHVFTRVFTRVLKSPEPTDSRWSLSEKNLDKPLFSRRSPRRSPRRQTPPHYKKDKKKSSRPNKLKDLNITLNVPEDSLTSLNTEDILSRIINCSDGDVDIDTLRDLRTQILGELKQTGANDDISDLILKSYKKKKKYNKRKDEVEDGELSDSESEAIDNIYGSLIVVDKDKGTSKQARTSEKEEDSRKIQICLVINSDKDSPSVKDNLDNFSNDDFEMFDDIQKPQEHEKPKEIESLYNKTSSSEDKTQGKVSLETKPSSSENKAQGKVSLENKESSSENKTHGKVSLETTKSITESNSLSDKNQNKSQEVITIDDDEEPKVIEPIKSAESVTQIKCINLSDSPSKNERTKKEEADPKPLPFKPNFYKPMNEEDNQEKEESQTDTVADKSQFNTALKSDTPKICDKPETKTSSDPTNFSKSETKTSSEPTNLTKSETRTSSEPTKSETITSSEPTKLTKSETKTSKEPTNLTKSETKTSSNSTNLTAVPESSSLIMKELESKKDKEVNIDRPESTPVEIPLLNEPTVPAPPPKKDVVSEIDILQALKNEILSENIIIPGSDVVTPALHQPKLTKVSSAQELMKKKRISIEKYKQKSVPTSNPSLFLKEPKSSMSNEDYAKKQSLKLTEKECERFNFPVKLALDESSDEDIADEYSLDDIYRNLAPESPENEQFTETGNVSPVIIPAEPVKAPTVATKTDIDMRTMPQFSPVPAILSASKPMSPSVGNESPAIRNELNKRPPLIDPRVRRENRTMNLESPNPYVVNSDRTPRPANFPNMTPNSRTYEMTPSRHSIDSDDSTSKKHVYAPKFSSYDPREHRQQSENRDMYNKQGQRVQWEVNVDTTNEVRRSRWETENRDSRIWDDRNSRTSDPRWDDRNPRSSVQRDVDYQKSRYNESDNYHRNSRNDRYGHDKRDDYPYSRLECPSTPSHSFGRSDCPATPTPSFGRLEAPMTPVHPFGRSECPTTPIHPFGRADCPPTPSHSFGRSECPTTPSHPFGRSDCPTTPIHPFGRSDIGMAPMTPNHPFGRSDYSQNPMNTASKLVKDPRLNRTDSDSSSHTYNDDSGYYNDRRKSDVQSRHYNTFDSHRNYSRDQSVRSDRNISYEHGGRSYNRDQTIHYEASMGRGNKDYETTNLYTRERGGRRDDYRREIGSDRNTEEYTRSFQRAHSVGRRISAEESFLPSSSRQGRDYRNETDYDNKLSVKPQTGSSFTIDTSVNKTFLEFLNGKGLQVFDYSFDAWRQRASSVGRSLTRESSVGRTKRESSVGRTLPEPIFDNSKLMRKDFVRARSMGRDMVDIKTEKSLKDIKADFESYSAKYKRKGNIEVPKEKEMKTMNYRDPRSRKFDKEKEIKERSNSASKSVYSPRKNSRDPRMSRDRFETKSRYKIDRRKNYGIVYSNDNIAKGTILGSGYGVKNYKIPKIKRVEPEVKTEIEKTKTTDNKDKAVIDKVTEKKTGEPTTKSKVVEKKQKESIVNVKVKESKVKGKEKSLSNNTTPEVVKLDDEIKSATIDITTRRTTRSNRKSETTDTKLSDDDSVTKRRPRKSVIYDSDSDSEKVNDNKDSDVKTSTKTESSRKLASPSKTKKAEKKDEVLNCSFGMDDLEIFPDNMASDSVMDNINALIADLDNDIDTSKQEDSNSKFQEDSNSKFSRDINLEKILGSYSSPDRTQDFAEDMSFKDITEFIKEDLDRSNSKPQEHTTGESNTKSEEPIEKDKENNKINITVTASKPDEKESVKVMPDAAEMKVILPNEPKQISNDSLNPDKESAQSIMHNEAIDSTTENDKEICKKVEEKVPEDLNNMERSLTPDSTNTEMQSSDKMGLPDSTNEIQIEMNSDITSTAVPVDSSKDVAEPSSSKQESNKLESIGNLLSILQDKSKIKELLSMLGDQSSDNEKIKKKLEKLSEIVSDDEDTNNVEDQEKKPESETKEHETTEDTKNLEMKTDLCDDKKDTDNENRISEQKAGVEDKIIEETTTNQNKEDTETAEKSKLEDEAVMQETDNASQSNVKKPRKVPLRRGRKGKWKTTGKPVVRVTRQAANIAKKPKITRELKQLQDDIKEMFISNDVLNSTGIRMCRLAKLVDEKSTNHEEENVILPKEVKPVVVLEKYKGAEEALLTSKMKKKPMPKSKAKASIENTEVEDKKEKAKPPPKYKPGPKSKTKPQQEDRDPYSFDPDPVSETNTSKETENDLQNSSESDNDSLSSSKSYGSSEMLAEFKKKPKRKRNIWKTGVIKPKKKKKLIAKEVDASLDDDKLNSKNHSEEDDKNTTKISFPDLSCFTDKKYCFSKGVSFYSCRLCQFSGTDIVHHYKRNHPHSEIPLSRMSPKIAEEAIDQCEDINFQAICQVRSWKHVCRFCFKEFNGKGRGKANKLEEFFWHVVSTHTGEYKQLCSDCINVTRCPFNLDIPPPPKEVKGQLLGYICGKCNFTQISLENLKTHVIVRHNDEQTAVYTISLGMMTKKTIEALMKRSENIQNFEQPRVLRSGRSNQSYTDTSDARSEITDSTDLNSELELSKRRSKVDINVPAEKSSNTTFENDMNSEVSNAEGPTLKVEKDDNEDDDQNFDDRSNVHDASEPETEVYQRPISDDIFDCAHFKVSYTDTGMKEYVCCVNGKDNHYKTSLLISMKKHIQHKHSEKWDGYCYVCKLIVTSQGDHRFKECFQHYLDKHIDNFPILEPVKPVHAPVSESSTTTSVEMTPPKPYINVRPISDLIAQDMEPPEENEVALPVIESVVSLGTAITPQVPSPGPSSIYSEPSTSHDAAQTTPVQIPQKQYKYEEAQSEVMSKKLRAVLDAMLSAEKLVKIYKCAGRFCSFTSDSAEDALLHASTHQRIGGQNALICAYCDFDCAGNAIDLVMHVFKAHGCCQYVCRKCFYRSSSSQLVRAHMLRMHGAEVAKEAVLMTDIVTPVVDDRSEILSRDVAVQHYFCQDSKYIKLLLESLYKVLMLI